jgi:hypothetical protein
MAKQAVTCNGACYEGTLEEPDHATRRDESLNCHHETLQDKLRLRTERC